MAFKVQKIEQKNSKRNLKRIFEEYRVIVQNCFFKDRTPSNFVGRIRSNLNFEVILKVKKAKKCKIVENCKIVFSIFWQIYWPQRAEILHSSFFLISQVSTLFCILHRSENTKFAPTSTTTTIPCSGFRHRQ